MAEAAAQQAKDQAELNELLSWAAARGLVADAEELVARGADPSARDKQGRCPAHYAAAHGHADVLQFLAAKGADLEAEDPSARTPLHHAAAAAGAAPSGVTVPTAALAYLIRQSAWLNAPDAGDNTPLHLAARCGWVDALKLLLAGGATLDVANKQGLSALGEAVAGGHVDAAAALLAAGAAPTWRADGYTLLHVAAGLGQPDTLRLLLEEPLIAALINDARNADRATPLHAAALAACLPAAELLLARRADAGAAGAGGLLAWQLAEQAAQQPQPQQAQAQELAGPQDDPLQSKKAAAAAAAKAAQQQRDAQRLAQLLKQAAGGKGGAAAAGGAQGAAAAAAAAGAPAALGPVEAYSQQFRALSAAEQERRVEALARLPVRELNQLSTLSKAAKAAVGQVRRANQLLAVYAAVAALRADEAFQEDASDPGVQDALADMGRTNNVAAYAGNAAVVSVATKLKKFHAVLQEAGGVRLGLPDLLIPPGASLQQLNQQDAGHVEGLQRAAVEARAAAAAAIAGRPASAGRAAGAPTAVSAAGGCEIQPAEPTSPASDTDLDRELRRHRRGVAAAGGGAAAAARPPVDVDAMPLRQRMLYEVVESFKRAVKIVGAMVLIFAVMYCLNLLPSQTEPAALEARMQALQAAQQAAAQQAAAAPVDAPHGGEL